VQLKALLGPYFESRFEQFITPFSTGIVYVNDALTPTANRIAAGAVALVEPPGSRSAAPAPA
jgi:hypothetical protein